MTIKVFPYNFTVCKVKSPHSIDLSRDFTFAAKTDDEISLVCKTEEVPPDICAREDGWKCMRIEGALDFSLVGILSAVTDILARNNIAVFALSTFNTDYLLVKAADERAALKALKAGGYTII